MLNPSEKAYCLALSSLSHKKYRQAADYFEKAVPFFNGNAEFALLYETTRLLVAVKSELAALENDENIMVIEEVFTDGQETNLP